MKGNVAEVKSVQFICMTLTMKQGLLL